MATLPTNIVDHQPGHTAAHNATNTEVNAAMKLAGTQTVTGDKDFTGALTKSGSALVVTSDSRLSDTRTPSNDALLAHLAGTETITGDKNFTGALTKSGSAVVVTSDSRLSDTRLPPAAGVTDAMLSTSSDVYLATLKAQRQRLVKPAGAIRETGSRWEMGGLNQGLACTSGKGQGGVIFLVAGDLLTSISFLSGSTGAVVPTHQWFWLADSSNTIIRKTSDDTTTAWAGNAVKTLNLSSQYTVTTTGVYFMGCGFTGTSLTLAGFGLSATVAAIAPAMTMLSTDTITDPASAPSAWTLGTPPANLPWGWVS